MVFSSSLFLFYFLPAVLFSYYFAPTKIKNLVIVLFSLFFYAWGAPKYVLMVLIAMTMDYVFAHQIYLSEGKKRKWILTLGLSINIGLLLFFKYANFFVINLNETLSLFGHRPVSFFKVALPIGISFFTFHEMSYLIDVYRKDKPPLKKFTDYAVYILFFPQLIAGPIIRFNEISDQIQNRSSNETIENRLIGFFRFVIGLSKKVLIANVVGQQADIIFSIPNADLSTLNCWIGAIAYTFQIYFDFSGYSDMAIGIARMMGFVFPENFNNPYISKNITEFWTRWHMTLGRWMRDYLYIPLGGNRVKTKARLYFNLSIVFIISGFWHGAAWNFIFWGVFHGVFLILDRLFLIKIFEKIGRLPSIIFTFLITIIGWVFFRSESLKQALFFIKRMFLYHSSDKHLAINSQFWTIMLFALFFSFITTSKWGEIVERKIFTNNYSSQRFIIMSLVCFILFIISVGNITSSGFNPFIYFRF